LTGGVNNVINGNINNFKNSQNKKIQRNKKIETIIDGNNDSFINELADLLNNVDVKEKPNKNLEPSSKNGNELIIKNKIKEENFNQNIYEEKNLQFKNNSYQETEVNIFNDEKNFNNFYPDSEGEKKEDRQENNFSPQFLKNKNSNEILDGFNEVIKIIIILKLNFINF